MQADTDCMGCATLRGFHNYANLTFFLYGLTCKEILNDSKQYIKISMEEYNGGFEEINAKYS